MPERIDTCPICAFTPDAETDVYTHVLTSHRKQAIAEALLERRPARPEPVR
ncbi:hypothetical protein C477_06636 [Haloterrigena salina JCM 13891]|uniref:Uncharacterized protein n=1 Tax=Haloterrigena salina JCM 13891 TaxID=1227488 RepID=M0CB87_9EURY|nr:hypothetical protein [Haloterrigena salina]ELZ20490.1 hypothetical protein C477_06636 [Haloterrigena salina JCM 13891]